MSAKPRKNVRSSSEAVAADGEIAVAPSEDGPDLGYRIALPAFEGPLDLLLHLIQDHKLDIFDIPIGFVAQKYVEYITLLQGLNIDLASEYLVMAATLAHIKSKMLLPTPPSEQEDGAEEDIDPRAELVRRLLEYQKYKHAAEELAKSPILGRDVFTRGAPAPNVEGPASLSPISVFKLFDAFQKLLSRVKQTAEHHIDVDRISISERILQLTDKLKGAGRVPFEQLFDEEMSRADLVVTFLAVLEMTRLRMMLVDQDGPLGLLVVELTLSDEHEEILHQVDGHDPLAKLSRTDVRHRADRSLEGEDSPIEGSPTAGDGGEEEALPADDPEFEEELRQAALAALEEEKALAQESTESRPVDGVTGIMTSETRDPDTSANAEVDSDRSEEFSEPQA